MYTDLTRPTFLGTLPDGAAGTRATLQLMSTLVRRFKTDPAIRQQALDLIGNLPSKRWALEVDALFRFVRDRIRYTRDTNGVETIQWPTVTLSVGQGDCDDKSTLLASLLESIGHPTRFVAIGPEPAKYSHVFVQTQLGSKWVSLDATMNVPMGWTPPRFVSIMIANN